MKVEDIKIRLEAIEGAMEHLKTLEQTPEMKDEMIRLEKLANKLRKKLPAEEKAWDKVVSARKLDRPRGCFYIETITTDFIECHGDRSFRDDPAIIGGIGKIGEHTVTLIVQGKGNTSIENMARNFGMPHPEGYRKALRLMKQAEKFNRPVVCLIDTPGAYCGLGAEERGQGEAIARNLMEMARLKVPVIAGIIGEGGSGGALALAVADKVFMQENTIYSILSPEGFASILWKDASRAKEAAEKMKITAPELLNYGIIDDIILEPVGGANQDPVAAADALKQYLMTQLTELKKQGEEERLSSRYERFRRFGVITQ